MLRQSDSKIEHKGQDQIHEDDDADDLYIILNGPFVWRLFRGSDFVVLCLFLLFGQLLDIGAQLVRHSFNNYRLHGSMIRTGFQTIRMDKTNRLESVFDANKGKTEDGIDDKFSLRMRRMTR